MQVSLSHPESAFGALLLTLILPDDFCRKHVSTLSTQLYCRPVGKEGLQVNWLQQVMMYPGTCKTGVSYAGRRSSAWWKLLQSLLSCITTNKVVRCAHDCQQRLEENQTRGSLDTSARSQKQSMHCVQPHREEAHWAVQLTVSRSGCRDECNAKQGQHARCARGALSVS